MPYNQCRRQAGGRCPALTSGSYVEKAQWPQGGAHRTDVDHPLLFTAEATSNRESDWRSCHHLRRAAYAGR